MFLRLSHFLLIIFSFRVCVSYRVHFTRIKIKYIVHKTISDFLIGQGQMIGCNWCKVVIYCKENKSFHSF